jgi:ABC-type nitrate/sulfonate/bicarbonate transport system permease component
MRNVNLTSQKTREVPNVTSRPQHSRWIRLGQRLIVPALVILGWWAASTSEAYGFYVPSPGEALTRAVSDYVSSGTEYLILGDAFWEQLVPSVARALLGFVLALILGVALGIAIGLHPVLSALAAPLVNLGRSLPTPALLGAFFILFGTGDMPKVLLIAFSVIWPILFNTIDGVKSIGDTRANVVSVFRVAPRDALFRILLPGIGPKVFAGARIALSLSLIVMIISELQKASNGLGYQLIYFQRGFDFEGFWSILILLAVVGLIFNFIFGQVERWALAWHRGATGRNA